MINLTVDDLLDIHKIVREVYPGTISGGQVNRNKLSDIAEKPLMRVYGHPVYDTVFKQAACLMESIIRLHPFPDGNKRAALLATYDYLMRDKRYLIVPLDTVRFMVDIARSEARTEDEIDELIDWIAIWLKERTATNSKEAATLLKRRVRNPALKIFLLSLTGIGLVYAYRKIRYWFVTDMHPEYAKNIQQTMAFLQSMAFYAGKAAKKQ